MDWYLYGNALVDETTDVVFTENSLDVWVSSDDTTLSGVAQDFTLTEKSTVLFSISLDAHSGTEKRNAQIILLDINGNILETHNLTFNENGSKIKKGYRFDLEAGNYTIIIGHSEGNYEVNGYADKLKIYPYVDFVQNPATHKKSVWIWDVNEITNLDNMLSTYQRLGIDCVYQYISETNIQNRAAELSEYIAKLHEQQMDCYIIYGDPAYYNNIEELKNKINLVNNYNITYSNNKLDGLIWNVEPHSSSLDSDGLTTEERIPIWTDNARIAYLYANSLGIRTLFANPVWYSSSAYAGTVLSFITFSDGISYMNYTKVSLIDDIEDEVEITKDNNCWMESISEIQNPEDDVDESITFYNEGIFAVHQAWQEIMNYFNYNKLSFSYHYLTPLKILMLDYDFNYLNEEGLTELINKICAEIDSTAEMYITEEEPAEMNAGDCWWKVEEI